MERYDVVMVGGGIAASALAKAMAEGGARVLVVEREREFRDRVRGEALAPWGVAELAALGLLDALSPAFADELQAWRLFIVGMQVAERPFAATTLPGRNWLAFYHPDLQRICIDAAAPPRGRIAYVFPQRARRARCYVGWNAAAGVARLQGESSFPRFRSEAEDIGIPRAALATARMAGPLATFEGADSWVEHPYRDGVALLGDAAATSDPTWGQGMSMALRGARVLRDALGAHDDWDAAGHAYAAEHDRTYEIVHRADGWFAQLFMDMGREADERRNRALPLLATDPTRAIDVPSSGPESPCDETARRRFFGED